jgi:hypothetical protein
MEREKHLETILSIVFGIAIIYWFTEYQPLIMVVILLSAIGLFNQFLSGSIHWFWTKLSHVMGYVMSKVILSIVFFIFLFPISLLAKLFSKKDSLQLKKGSGSSYYSERNHPYSADDLENPW